MQARHPDTETRKLTKRCSLGTWLGRDLETNQHVLCSRREKDDHASCETFRRKNNEQSMCRFDWNTLGGEESRIDIVRFPAPPSKDQRRSLHNHRFQCRICLRLAFASERSEAPRMQCRTETSKPLPSAMCARNRRATISTATTSTPKPTRSRLLTWPLEETQTSRRCSRSTSHFGRMPAPHRDSAVITFVPRGWSSDPISTKVDCAGGSGAPEAYSKKHDRMRARHFGFEES